MNPFDNVEVNDPGFAYRDLVGQDKWLDWTPTRTSWTDVGTAPVVNAKWRDVGAECQIQVKVVPGTTVATTAGTSYISLPKRAAGLAGAGVMYNATTLVAIGNCVVDVTNSRLYVPSQTAIGDTIMIVASYQI